MSELRDILREEYIRQMQNLDLRSLLEMIEDVMDSPRSSLAEEEKPEIDLQSKDEARQLQVLLNLIPDIAVSELGWSDVETSDEGAVIGKGPQRQLLEGYLSNVTGTNLKEKINKVSAFYKNGLGLIESEAGSDRTKTIVQAISYLVFYKTLTKVITNFNASSAGFSFESFLAVLSDGYQIPANTGTIADYVDRSSGEIIPVSLKLYREGGLEVGGSYKDLVRDLTMAWKDPQPWSASFPNAMRYVVCTKTLEGDDLLQEGNIQFYQFDFTLKNVMEIMITSGEKSQQCIRIPQEVMSLVTGAKPITKQMETYMDGVLPSQSNLPSSEELETVFTDQLKELIKAYGLPISDEQFGELTQALEFAKSEKIFLPADPKTYGGGAEVGIVRGQSELNKKFINDQILDKFSWVKEMPRIFTQTKRGPRSKSAQSVLLGLIANKTKSANAAAKASVGATKQKDKRKAELNRMAAQGEFLSAAESAQQYGILGVEQQRICLLNSLGFLKTLKFHITQTQVLGLPGIDDLGKIEIGRKKIAEMLRNATDLLNKEVGEIFQALADLSESLNRFFANLDKDVGNSANVAISSAQSISKKDILTSKKTDPEQATQLGLPGIGE